MTTPIPWVKNPDNITQGESINEITGCLNQMNGLCNMGQFPCYAYKLANTRLRERYLVNDNLAGGFPSARGVLSERLAPRVYPFYPRLWPEKFAQIRKRKKPTGYFHCDMSDWLGIGVPEEWSQQIVQVCRDTPWHRHYLLTKQPQNLIKYSPYPDQCWVGVTATNSDTFDVAFRALWNIEASVKFLSLEPLLDWTRTTNLERPLSKGNGSTLSEIS